MGSLVCARRIEQEKSKARASETNKETINLYNSYRWWCRVAIRKNGTISHEGNFRPAQFEAVLHAHFSSICCSKTILIIWSGFLRFLIHPKFGSEFERGFGLRAHKSFDLVSKEDLKTSAESLFVNEKRGKSLRKETNKTCLRMAGALILIIEIKIYRKNYWNKQKKIFFCCLLFHNNCWPVRRSYQSFIC
jgi:hypothetical protein